MTNTKMTPEEFAAGAQQVIGTKEIGHSPDPAPVLPPSSKPHWTARTDRLGAVRLAPRRGYGTESLFIWAFKDGSLVVGGAELSPAAATRLITVWSARFPERAQEFEYVASPTVTVKARWTKFGDGAVGFSLRDFDRSKPITDTLPGVVASEREALVKLKELLVLRGKP